MNMSLQLDLCIVYLHSSDSYCKHFVEHPNKNKIDYSTKTPNGYGKERQLSIPNEIHRISNQGGFSERKDKKKDLKATTC